MITYHVLLEPVTHYQAPENREAAIEDAVRIYGLTPDQTEALKMHGEVMLPFGALRIHEIHAPEGYLAGSRQQLEPTQLPVGYVLRPARSV